MVAAVNGLGVGAVPLGLQQVNGSNTSGGDRSKAAAAAIAGGTPACVNCVQRLQAYCCVTAGQIRSLLTLLSSQINLATGNAGIWMYQVALRAVRGCPQRLLGKLRA
jgi:hypothetical protein